MNSYNLNILSIMWLASFLLVGLGLSRMFKLAGEQSWKAFVPFYRWWPWIKIIGRPSWYFIGMLIPCINILFTFNLCLDIVRAFGKHKFWEQFMGTVLTFIYFPILYFQKDLKYGGQSGTQEWRTKNVPKNAMIREWADAILFALFVAGGMRALFFDLYQIPTASMESNMRVGDNLVVSRTGVGMRIPFTPLAIPIIGQKTLPFTQIPAYSSLIQLPYMRLLGWTPIKNNDIVVFNWPAEFEDYPIDKADNYVKRCVGIPGDSLLIRKGQVYINGKALPTVDKWQKRYVIQFKLKQIMSSDFLAEYDLGDCEEVDIPRGIYTIRTWQSNAQLIAKDSRIQSIAIDSTASFAGHSGLFMPVTYTGAIEEPATLDHYGPFYLPKRGETIKLNRQNFMFYQRAINIYERNNISMNADKFYDGDKEINSYTFKYDYYWMMGDNRYNSLDSRMWGYVPESHIIGKPLFTFFGRKMVQVIDEVGTPIQAADGSNKEYTSYGIRMDKILRPIK